MTDKTMLMLVFALVFVGGPSVLIWYAFSRRMSIYTRGSAVVMTAIFVAMSFSVEPVIASPDFGRAYISSPNGSHLGYTTWQGNQQVAFAENGTRLGYYDRATDTTRSANGQIVARGNAVAAFIITLR